MKLAIAQAFFGAHLDLTVFISEWDKQEGMGRHSLESQLCPEWDTQDKDTSGKQKWVVCFPGSKPITSTYNNNSLNLP